MNLLISTTLSSLANTSQIMNKSFSQPFIRFETRLFFIVKPIGAFASSGFSFLLIITENFH